MITSFDSQLATSLLTTCNIFFVNKLSQTIRTNSNINLLIRSLLQDVDRLFGYIIGCAFNSAYGMVDSTLMKHLKLL